jgi:hypothetical protein
LVEAALCDSCQPMSPASSDVGDVLLGTAKRRRSFKLLPKRSVMKGRLLLPCRALCAMRPISFALSTPFVNPMVIQEAYQKKRKEWRKETIGTYELTRSMV